jgi:hypothetical protein
MRNRGLCVFAYLILWLGASSAGAQSSPSGKDEPKAEWTVPVLVLRYFPVTADKEKVDIAVTSNVGGSLKEIQAKCDRMTEEAIEALQEGSRFRAYNDPKAPLSLKYVVVDTFDYLDALPRNPGKQDKADYIKVLERAQIQHYVEEKGVKEVWIWGYHSKDLSPWESNMSSPFGDVSNSDRDPLDLPVFKETYTVYHYNYERDTSEAVHNHIHQIEAVMRQHGGELWRRWEGEPGEAFSSTPVLQEPTFVFTSLRFGFLNVLLALKLLPSHPPLCPSGLFPVPEVCTCMSRTMRRGGGLQWHIK